MIAMLVGKNREPVHHPFESQKSRLIFFCGSLFFGEIERHALSLFCEVSICLGNLRI